MDFAADAVIDVIAPPPPGRAGAAAPETSGPSFDDHLEAAAQQETPSVQTEDHGEGAGDARENDSALAQNAAPPAQPTPPLAAAPLVLQLIDLEGGPIEEAPPATQTSAETAPASSAPPQAPSAPMTAKAPAAPSQTPAAQSEDESADLEGADAVEVSPEAPKQTAQAEHKPVAPPPQHAPQHNAQQSQPVNAPAQTPVVETAATTATTETTAIATQAASAAATTVQPRPVAQPGDKAQKAKPDVQGADAQSAVKTEAGTGKEAVATQKAQPNASGVQQKSAEASPLVIAETSASPQPTTASALPLTTTSTTLAAQAQHAVLDQAAARAAPASAQVAREIVRRFDGESTRFELRLDPPELGRIEVRLEVSRDHRVTAVVAADSPQALTELARHARDLEQSLQSAGLQLAENGLSFDLRQSQGEANEAGERNARNENGGAEDASAETAIVARPIGLERWRGVRVDVMV